MNRNVIKKITDNAYAYSVIAKLFSVAIGLIYSALYSRYLGAELRGDGAIIQNIAYFGSIFMCLGIYQAYPYFKKQGRPNIYMEFINNILGLFLVYFTLCALGIVFLPVSTNVKCALAMMPLMMAIKELNYVVLVENPKLRNTASIYLNLIDIIIVALLMLFTTASYLYCIGFLLVKEFIYFCIAFRNLRIKITSIHPTIKHLKPYIKYGFIPMLTVILMEVNYKVDVLMLDGQVTKAAIGVYSLGVQLAERLWLVPDALRDILLSKLAKGKTVTEVAKITRISFWVMLFCVALAALIGKPAVLLVFGAEYANSYQVMLVILLGVIGMVFYKMVYSYNVVNGHKNVNFLILGMAAVANVCCNYFFIPIWGNMGAAVASLVSYLACGMVFLLYFTTTTGTALAEMLLLKKSDLDQLKKLLSR